MKRNLEEAIKSYRKRTNNEKTTKYGKYAFYTSDLEQIVKMSGGKEDDISNLNVIEAVFCSLEAGFEIGYRTAKREQQTARK